MTAHWLNTSHVRSMMFTFICSFWPLRTEKNSLRNRPSDLLMDPELVNDKATILSLESNHLFNHSLPEQTSPGIKDPHPDQSGSWEGSTLLLRDYWSRPQIRVNSIPAHSVWAKHCAELKEAPNCVVSLGSRSPFPSLLPFHDALPAPVWILTSTGPGPSSGKQGDGTCKSICLHGFSSMYGIVLGEKGRGKAFFRQ